MSCDGNRRVFFQHLAGPGTEVAETFGGQEQAVTALERIFNASRRIPTSDPQAQVGRVKTEQLFAEMRNAGISPPTHSRTGLPRRDAQQGYAQVYDSLTQIRRRQPLDNVTQQAMAAVGAGPRQRSAPKFDSHGLFRCPNCGQFASQTRGHSCPQTASVATVARFLQRRTGAPLTAFDRDNLAAMITEAQENERGVIQMAHSFTGEVIAATLDGSLVALQQGYRPSSWEDGTLVLLGDRVLAVDNLSGLREVTARTVFEMVAHEYGLALRSEEAVRTLGQGQDSRNPQHALRGEEVIVGSGGERYDLGRFLGSEYRRHGSRGREIVVGSETYTVGQRFEASEIQHRSSARIDGRAVVVGRTTTEAAHLLRTGHVHRPLGTSRVEFYDADGTTLLAVFDQATGRVAGTSTSEDGSPMTPEQVAVVMGGLMGEFPSLRGDLVESRLPTMTHARSTVGVADSGYLAIRQYLESGNALSFGNTLIAEQCPDCGRWMGDIHTCPEGEGYSGFSLRNVHQLNLSRPNTRRDLQTAAEWTQYGVPLSEGPQTGTRYQLVVHEGGAELHGRNGLIGFYDAERNLIGQERSFLQGQGIACVLAYHMPRDEELRDLVHELVANLPNADRVTSLTAKIATRLERLGANNGVITQGPRCENCGRYTGVAEHDCPSPGRSEYVSQFLAFCNAVTEPSELEVLPGVGPATAPHLFSRLQRYRQANGDFTSASGLPHGLHTFVASWSWRPGRATPVPTPDELAQQRRAREVEEAQFQQQLGEIPVTNVNTASVEELTQFPGLGSTIAGRIVEARQRWPISSARVLANRVSGLSVAHAERISSRLSFDPPSSGQASRNAQQEVTGAIAEAFQDAESRIDPGYYGEAAREYTYEAFQEVYSAARDRRRDGDVSVPFMRENAMGGLATPGTGRTFGVEIEFVGGDRRAIGRDLHAAGLTGSPHQAGYHSGRGSSNWRFEHDGSVDGEIISPPLHDTPEAWQQLETVCRIVQSHGGRVNRQCGGHVHVGNGDYDHTPANHERLMRMTARNQDVLFRLSQDPEARRHRGYGYCAPIREPRSPYRSISEARGARYNALNFEHVRGSTNDHVEFRSFDGSLDPGVIQTRIKLALGMVEAARHLDNDAVAAMPDQPLGYHVRRNSSREPLAGDAWQEQTSGFRSLIARLFSRDADRAQVTALFASTTWQRG